MAKKMLGIVALLAVLTGCQWNRDTFGVYHVLNTGEPATEAEIDSGLREIERLAKQDPAQLQHIETVFGWALRNSVSPNGRVLTSAGLYRMRQCESTDNYRINTGNGYYGAYQFSVSTWNYVAEMYLPQMVGVRPDTASRLEQDAMTKILWSMPGGGPHHWPVCGRRV